MIQTNLGSPRFVFVLSLFYIGAQTRPVTLNHHQEDVVLCRLHVYRQVIRGSACRAISLLCALVKGCA